MLNRRVGVALGGLSLALAFPKPDWWPLAFVAIVPLIIAARQVRLRRAFGLGFVFGCAYHAVTLYWLVLTMTRYGGVPLPLAVLGYLLLVGYLSLYQGAFGLVAAHCAGSGLRVALTLAAAWTGLEYVQAWMLTGFPWVLLGYAAGASSLLAQAADLGGVWGLSFLALFVNAVVASMLVSLPRRRSRGSLILAVLATLAIWAGYGGWRLTQATAPGADALSLGMVQGNVSQDRKWDVSAKQATLERHLQLSADAAARGAELVLWPESSWPDAYGAERDPVARVRLSQFAETAGVAMLVGTVHVEGTDGGYRVANTAALLDPSGRWRGRYDKSHLVPFGEYLPLQRWLRFLGPMVQAVGALHPGASDQDLLALPDAGIEPFGVAICYEVVFPGLVRDQVLRGASFLVTITNDAWFGTSSGPYQHFAMARLRAVENRRYLARAANTGVSGLVDPWGRVLVRSELETETVLVGEIEPRGVGSLYTRVGDALPQACLVVLVLSLVVGGRRRDDGV